jgi:hypothetical protein
MHHNSRYKWNNSHCSQTESHYWKVILTKLTNVKDLPMWENIPTDCAGTLKLNRWDVSKKVKDTMSWVHSIVAPANGMTKNTSLIFTYHSDKTKTVTKRGKKEGNPLVHGVTTLKVMTWIIIIVVVIVKTSCLTSGTYLGRQYFTGCIYWKILQIRSAKLLSFCRITQCHSPENHDMNLHCCDHLIFCVCVAGYNWYMDRCSPEG